MTSSIVHGQYPQRRPNGLWRGTSAMVMGLTGTLSKTFLYGLNDLEVFGLDNFMQILESRRDPSQRQRGLITGTATTPILTSSSFISSHAKSYKTLVE